MGTTGGDMLRATSITKPRFGQYSFVLFDDHFGFFSLAL